MVLNLKQTPPSCFLVVWLVFKQDGHKIVFDVARIGGMLCWMFEVLMYAAN